MSLTDGSPKSFLRDVVGEYMVSLGEKSDKVISVTAGAKNTCRLTSFVDKFPARYFNVGIAEQNMVSFAAGLAHEGFIPYVFTMAPFLTMRACEQCRTDVAYGNLNVRLMSTYSGLSGGISGATHWAMEDVAIMRGIPGIAILEPSDPIQAVQMMDFTLGYQGPVYLRTSVEPFENIYTDDYKFEFGRASVVSEGDDGAFLCSGITVQFAKGASDRLYKETGRKIRVIDMHTIKPVDREAVLSAASTGRVVVAQDHNIIGGLGEAVSSVLAQESRTTKLKVLGIPDRFEAMAHAPYLYRKFGYDSIGLEKAMRELLFLGGETE